MSENLLSNFKIDRWFKVFLYVGVILFVISLSIEVKWLTNETVGWLGLSILFIGLGEWKNEKTAVEPAPGGFVQYPLRPSDVIGWTLIGIGIVCLLFFFGEIL